jgi:broad specificity phosphatase PhoE
MLLYMIRHGETENNLAKRHSGHSLTLLTEKGILDAKRAGEKLVGISFDKVYASDLPRTRQTAKEALPDAEPVILPLIKEIDVGACTDKSVADCEAEFGEGYIKAKRTFDYTAFGGENVESLQFRARTFLKMLEESGRVTVATLGNAVLRLFRMRDFVSLIQEYWAQGDYILSPAPGQTEKTVLRDGCLQEIHFKDALGNPAHTVRSVVTIREA